MTVTATASALTGYPPIGAVAYAANRNDLSSVAGVGRTDTAAPRSAGNGETDAGRTGLIYARFVSPVIEYDCEAREVVVRHRNPADGKVVLQIPSEAALRQYEEAVRRADRQRQEEMTGPREERATPAGIPAKSATAPVDITIAAGSADAHGSVRSESSAVGAGSSGMGTPPPARSRVAAAASSPSANPAPVSSASGSVTAGTGADSGGAVRSSGGSGGAAFNLVV